MIAANELRIGNWYKQLHTGAYTQVDLFLFHELYDDETYADHLQPIPLSPEILVKSGFENLFTEYTGSFYKDRLLIEWGIYDVIFARLQVDDENSNYIGEIKYLHQLQNLYFALTQTELTINLS